MTDRIFFGLFAAGFFAVALFGRSLDFRWRNRATGPIIPSWIGRLLFVLFGMAFLLAAIYSR